LSNDSIEDVLDRPLGGDVVGFKSNCTVLECPFDVDAGDNDGVVEESKLEGDSSNFLLCFFIFICSVTSISCLASNVQIKQKLICCCLAGLALLAARRDCFLCSLALSRQ